MILKWSITEMNAIEGVIKSVKYLAELSDNGQNVQSEGYWYFEQDDGIPISALTEENVIEWVRQGTMKDGQNMVEQRLIEQMNAMAKPVHLPWKPAVFKLDL
jgi:hypothetical protein